MTEIVFDGNLKTALNSSPIILSGSRLLLHAGTYSGNFINSLAGVTVMSYPGEHAIIDGLLLVNGSSVIFQDLEILYSGWTTRQSTQSGSTPSDIPFTKKMDVYAPSCKFINCVIHDLAGVGLWTQSTAAEFNGCVIYNIGWLGTDRGHGHGLYTQNNTPAKTIKDCIIFDCFGYGVHCYTEAGAINNYLYDGCTCFNAGSLANEQHNNILVGGLQVADTITVQNCMTYNSGGVNIGYNAGANNVTLTDNYFQDGITKVNVTPTESGNYYGPAVGNQVFLHANDYDANRANLAIYNQAAANTVAVDTTGVFANGDVLNVHNVQDYFVDIQELTVAGNSITVNMQAVNRSVATPVGWNAPATTFPQFGAFVLQKI